MTFKDLVLKARSYRKFDGSKPLTKEALVALVDIARISPSSGNLQPLKYRVVYEPRECEAVFPALSWTSDRKDWTGPEPEDRPVAYIVILRDDGISHQPGVDHGIAAWSLVLAAADQGLGSCMFGLFNQEALREALGIPETCEILLVLALGTPRETIVLEDSTQDKIAYYRDPQDRGHVPKRPLTEVLLEPGP